MSKVVKEEVPIFGLGFATQDRMPRQTIIRLLRLEFQTYWMFIIKRMDFRSFLRKLSAICSDAIEAAIVPSSILLWPSLENQRAGWAVHIPVLNSTLGSRRPAVEASFTLFSSLMTF